MELLQRLPKIIIRQGSKDFCGCFALPRPNQRPQGGEPYAPARICANESQSNFDPSLVHRQLGYELGAVLLAPLCDGLLPVLAQA
jgi:hypothetical protein